MDGIDPTRLCQLWIEVSDLARAQAFYEKVFGWRPVPADLHEMVVLDVPPTCPFGVALIQKARPENQGSPTPPTLAPHPGRLKAAFAVEKPETLVNRCLTQGGTLLSGPTPYLGYGLMWDIADPDGIPWGLFQKADAPLSASGSPLT